MDDPWLDQIQQPARLEGLLAAFARQSGLLPARARHVRNPKALPVELQGVLRRAVAHPWVAFSGGSRHWLFTGVVSLGLSQLLKAPVLQINFYDETGALIDMGAWSNQRDGEWRRVDNLTSS